MKVHQTELISALADGELHGRQKRAVERHLRECLVCDAEYRHLLHVREMLAANPPHPAMSDSAEFFWSKVKRDIQSHGVAAVEEPAPSWSLWDWVTGHALPLATAAAVVLAVLVSVQFLPARLHAPTVLRATAGLPDTYATPLAADDDTTTIWLSGIPWTEDLNQLQTLFANPET